MRRIAIGGRALICVCCLGVPLACAAVEHVPPLMHAESYDADDHIDVTRYWWSEKLDGVRAYWNGRQLITRGGNVIATPEWFTEGWPSTPLDGELWGGRGSFEQTSGVVRSATADERWRAIRYFAFDLPAERGTFDERLLILKRTIDRSRSDRLAMVDQNRVQNLGELESRLREIESGGGEGLMLHRGEALYVAARTDDLLKYKSFADAEAVVVGYVTGNGKYEGLMGALIVEREDGVRFKLGSGFTDQERRHPPALGSSVTYAYNGLTGSGLPRFARFLRIRRNE
jgi:DNA ligase 1